MRFALSSYRNGLYNRLPRLHWRPICLPPKEAASLPCLIQVNEDDPSASSLSRRRIRSTGHGGKQTRGLSKRDYGRHIEEFHNVRGRPDAVRFRDRTGIAKCDVSAT